jgi:hypothetical protein
VNVEKSRHKVVCARTVTTSTRSRVEIFTASTSSSANSVADVNQDTNQDIFHEHSYSSPVGFVLTFSVVAEKNKLIKFSKCINY